MSRTLLRAAAVILLLAGLVAGVRYATRTRPVDVLLHTVSRGSVESTVANTRAGTVKACRRARLAPPSTGTVSRLPVDRGDTVEKGALLLEVWNEDLNAQRALADAESRAASSRREQTCLAADLAAREATRLERLFADGVVGEEAVDRARSQRETAAAGCKAAAAVVEEARARVAVVRAALSRTRLVAPFDGIVAEVNAELGEVVTPSPPGIPTPPAIDLFEAGCLYVVAPIDEVDAPSVVTGLPARITLDAYKDGEFAGTVRGVAPYVLDLEKQARTIEVEVNIVDPHEIQGLVPGYSADVEILLDARDDVLRVPSESLIDGRRVLVLAGDRLVEREIETGVANWRWTEIRAGLDEGDRVVVSLDREGVADGALARPADGANG